MLAVQCTAPALRDFLPADSHPGKLDLVVDPQPQAELRGVMLNVASVIDVKLGAGKVAARQVGPRGERLGRFGGDRRSRFVAAMLEIVADRRLVVPPHRLAVLELFVVTEEGGVLLVKRLPLERLRVRAQVVVGVEQCVKRHSAESVIADTGVPGRLRTTLDAVMQRAEGGGELVGDELIDDDVHMRDHNAG